MKKSAITFLLLAIGSGSAMAGEVYGQIGTEGLGVGYSQAVAEQVGIRGEFNYASVSHTQNSGDLTYDGKLKLGGAAILADYFPFSGTFHVTGGAIINQGKLTGVATSNGGVYTINDKPYVATSGDSVTANVKFGNVNPYLGVGFGHAKNNKGLSFFSDIGVIFQKPTSSVNVSGNLATRVNPADVAAESAKLQDSVDKFKYYPVVKIGLGYAF